MFSFVVLAECSAIVPQTFEDIKEATLMPNSVAVSILQKYQFPASLNYSQFAQSVDAVVYNQSKGILGLQVGNELDGGFCLRGMNDQSSRQVFLALQALGCRALFYSTSFNVPECSPWGPFSR